MPIVKVSVTQDDIAAWKSNPLPSVMNCPLAHAGRRTVPNFDHVGPTYMVLSADNDAGHVKIDLPPEAQKVVRMADVQTNVSCGILKADLNDVDQETIMPVDFSVYVPG